VGLLAFLLPNGVTKSFFVTLPILLVFGCGGGIITISKGKREKKDNDG
jgi:hypothetical protein